MAYIIKSGDTLSQIAKNNNTTVADIQAANPSITNPNRIYAGQTINIPGQGGASQAGAAPSTSKSGAAGAVTKAAKTAPVTNKAPDYSQYEYDASSDPAYMQAMTLLEQAQKNTPTYNDTWDGKLEEIYNQIVNREKFSYDLNADALYQQYKDQYTLQGKLAMMDTMGQAAAMTGGYGNSYAQSVGQQAYQGYLQQLNDVVPELYGMALDQYNQEGQDLYNQFSMAGSMRDNEYGRYQDDLSNWWQNVGYLTDRADNTYDQGYTNWYNAQQMGVDADERAYNRELDAYEMKQDSYEKLVSLITTTGYTPSAEELTAAGMSNGEAAAYANYYKEQKAAETAATAGKSSGSSSGSSSSRSSGTSNEGNGGNTYDNGSLSSAQVKELQNVLGVEADGFFGPNSQAAAKKLGYSSAEEAYNALVKNNGGDYDIEKDLNSFISMGAKKSEINAFLREALNSGVITQSEYKKYKEIYAPAGHTY